MTPTADTSTIACGTHGKRVASIVCIHLLTAKDRCLGFVENSSDPLDLQAWCSACEAKFLEEGDMTQEFREFNDMHLVCDFCYATIKARHSSD